MDLNSNASVQPTGITKTNTNISTGNYTMYNTPAQNGRGSNPTISLFSTVKEKRAGGTITESQLVAMIRTGRVGNRDFGGIIQKIRGEYTARGKTDLYDSLKTRLPAATLSGLFPNGHKAANITQPSGIIHCDFDKLGSERAKDLRARLQSDPLVRSAMLSPGGVGLKASVAYQVEGDNPQEWIAHHRRVFDAVSDHFLQGYGITNDPSVSDISRAMYLTHDPDIYYNPASRVLTLPPPPITNFTLRGGEYLSDIIDDVLSAGKLLLLHGDTGIGKTQTMLQIPKVILAGSVQSALLQAKSIARGMGKNVGCYYQHEKTKEIAACDVILTTYESLTRLLLKIPNAAEWTLAIDEIHNVFTSGSVDFRNKGLCNVINAISEGSQWKQIVLLSGTPGSYSQTGFTTVRVEKSRPQPYMIRNSNQYTATYKEAAYLIVHNRASRHFVYLNSKGERLDAFRALLENGCGCEKNAYTPAEILIINADERDAQMNVVENDIPDSVKVVIATAVIKESFSIRAEFDYLHTLEFLSSIESQQLVARFRTKPAFFIAYTKDKSKKEKDDTQSISDDNDYQDHVTYLSHEECKRRFEKMAEESLEFFVTEKAKWDATSRPANIRKRFWGIETVSFQENPLVDWDNENEVFFINIPSTLAVAHQRFTAGERHNIGEWMRNVEGYGFILTSFNGNNVWLSGNKETNKMLSSFTNAAKAAGNAKRAEQHTVAIGELRDKKDLITARKDLDTLSEEAKNAFRRISEAISENEQKLDSQAYPYWLGELELAKPTRAKQNAVSRAARWLSKYQKMEWVQRFFNSFEIPDKDNPVCYTQEELRKKLVAATAYLSIEERVRALSVKRIGRILGHLFEGKQHKEQAKGKRVISISFVGYRNTLFEVLHKRAKVENSSIDSSDPDYIFITATQSDVEKALQIVNEKIAAVATPPDATPTAATPTDDNEKEIDDLYNELVEMRRDNTDAYDDSEFCDDTDSYDDNEDDYD